MVEVYAESFDEGRPGEPALERVGADVEVAEGVGDVTVGLEDITEKR